MMQAPWCHFAVRHTFPGWATGLFRDATHRKAVWHTTQGGDEGGVNSGLFSWYEQNGGIPHFTIMTGGTIYQHYACNKFSRALRNQRGGVETNTDGAIQVEIVGFAGKEHTAKQRKAITDLAAWLTQEQHVEPVFPMGRLSVPYERKATEDEWDNGVGHWAHAVIPENPNRTDPNMTDLTWQALLDGVNGGNWLRTETPIEKLQGLLWDEGYAKPPFTAKTYPTRESWVDGFDGPETQRAKRAYDKALIEAQNTTPQSNPKPAFTIKEANEIHTLVGRVESLVNELTPIVNRLKTWANKGS